MSQLKNDPNILASRIGEGVVTVSPLIMSGAPVFTDTRVPVKNLFDYLADGLTLDEFFVSFPNVTREQVSILLRQIGGSFDLD